jgi:hypothetical protein
MSLHVISESKIRPTTTEIGDFEASGNDGAVLARLFSTRDAGLPCSRRAGILAPTKREDWMNRLIMRRNQFRTMVQSAIIN